MGGPVAPKDAEKERPFFYIMREQEIFGAEQENGKGVQFIYQNDGRLISSATIVGNITDAEELKLLETTDGFRRLVHSMGITMETEDKNEQAQFVYQMYGKENVYGGGTILTARITGDGAETRVYLEDIEWKEDDWEPGQMRFEMDMPKHFARVSVRFYLQDGFTAPIVEEEDKVDVTSPDYQALLDRAIISLGSTRRLERTLAKAKNGEEVTLSFIGGSITQGAGAIPISTKSYASQTVEAFSEKYAGDQKVRLIKAGVGGTPSQLGMLRFDRDVLRDGEKPDVVVIEFAVNDAGDETMGDCYESLVRKVLSLPWEPAVILLFSVFADDYNLQERLIPVGEAYDLPMVSMKNAVTPQFYLKREEGRVLSKNQYFYDRYHPSNLGHQIMADCLLTIFDRVNEQMQQKITTPERTKEYLKRPPVIGNTFEKVKLLDRKTGYDRAKIQSGSFGDTDTNLQKVEMDNHLTPTAQFPYNWFHAGKGGQKTQDFTMEIACRALLIICKDSGDLKAGRAEIFVDGERKKIVDPHENGWIHCNAIIIFSEKDTKTHIISVKMVTGDENKEFTILGFGYVE